jgi:uncharacterized membrane protein YdbT with pleckstrin-like domain
MSYIDKNLLADETVLFRTKKHVIVFLFPFILAIASIVIFVYMRNNAILAPLAFVPSLIVFLIWCRVGLDYLTSEYAVTNKRIMMREGFFIRHANEMRLTAISQVNVDQNLFGQLLDYGVVSINAFGAFDAYPLIAHNFVFQKYVNEQVDKAS